MIKRYSRPEMEKLWSQLHKYETWLKIETSVCEAYLELDGKGNPSAIEELKTKVKINPDRIDEIEKEVKHDVIAFLSHVTEQCELPQPYLHYGMTSSDVLDTSFSINLKESGELILTGLKKLLSALKEKAQEHKNQFMIGRTHGIQSEPITAGLKFAYWYDILNRCYSRIERAVQQVGVGKISGAVGTYANIDPKVEEFVCKQYDITPANIATQIVSRDYHAEYFNALAITASSIELIATEIRGYQRTEISEMRESFTKGQKGSSAMPHKRNPILSENLTGLARLVRSYALPAMENIALWHERDISHSSVERVNAPDATILMDFMIHRTIGLIKNIFVDSEKMKENFEMTRGMVFSQQVLLAMVEAGIKRDEAYKIIQRNALRCYDEQKNFRDLLLEDKEVTQYLSAEKIEQCFSLDYHLKHVDTIFERVFSN